MIFINRSGVVIRHMLVSFILLTTTACQFIPSSVQQTAEVIPEDVAPIKTTNPYLDNRPSITAQASRQFEQARAALAAEDWPQAETLLVSITESSPELSGPYLSLAQLYSRTGQTAKADSSFKQAIVANANNVNAYNQYAVYLRQQGDFAGAQQQYRKALTVWPDYPDGHLNLGILYDLYMGKLALAVAEYQQYQALIDEPDRQVKGWIVDAQRRLKKQQSL